MAAPTTTERVVSWTAIANLVDRVHDTVRTHGHLLKRVTGQKDGEQLQEVLAAALKGRPALDAVDPEACSDVLKSLVLALEPRLLDSQGFAALQAAISAAQSVEAAAGLHEELMSFLPPDEADLLMGLLRLLVAGVEAGVEAQGIAFAWGSLLGLPGDSTELMARLLASE